jgi:hypothetical protein
MDRRTGARGLMKIRCFFADGKQRGEEIDIRVGIDRD